MIGFSNKGEWAQVLEPKDQILYNNNVKSLKEFINTFNIRGVIFDYSFNVFVGIILSLSYLFFHKKKNFKINYVLIF